MDVGMVVALIVSGAVIGLLARLLVPGRNPIGLIATLLVGIVGAVVGGYLGDLVAEDTEWIGWIFGIVIAAVLVALLSLPSTMRRRSLRR